MIRQPDILILEGLNVLQTGPALTILKRPSSAASNSSSSAQDKQNALNAAIANEKKSLKERERAYEEAKKRIYGDAPSNSAAGNGNTGSKGKNSPRSSSASLEGGVQQQQKQQRPPQQPNPKIRHIPKQPPKPER